MSNQNAESATYPLRDEGGSIRLVVQFTPGDDGNLALLIDPEGKARARVQFGSTFTQIGLLDESGQDRATLTLGNEGEPQVTLR